MEGMDTLIKSCWNEVAKTRTKIFRQIAEGKINDSIELEERANNMSSQLNKLIKEYTAYKKYTDMVNKATPGKLGKMYPVKNNQPSSNGPIVAEVPKN